MADYDYNSNNYHVSFNKIKWYSEETTQMSSSSNQPNLEPRMVKIESKTELLEKNIDEIKKLLEKIDNKIDSLSNRLESKIDNINNKLEAKTDKINDRLWSNFVWIVGIIITLFVIGTGSTILTILLKHFN